MPIGTSDGRSFNDQWDQATRDIVFSKEPVDPNITIPSESHTTPELSPNWESMVQINGQLVEQGTNWENPSGPHVKSVREATADVSAQRFNPPDPLSFAIATAGGPALKSVLPVTRAAIAPVVPDSLTAIGPKEGMKYTQKYELGKAANEGGYETLLLHQQKHGLTDAEMGQIIDSSAYYNGWHGLMHIGPKPYDQVKFIQSFEKEYQDLIKIIGADRVSFTANMAENINPFSGILSDMHESISDIVAAARSKINAFISERRLAEHLKEVDWKDLRNQYAVRAETPNAISDPEHYGFNLDFPLFKGRTGAAASTDFEGLPMPTSKSNERGLFFSNKKDIAKDYGYSFDKGTSYEEFVLRNPRTVEVNWPDVTGHHGYASDDMHRVIEAAHRKGADLLVVKNISDIGGKQDQFVLLNPTLARYSKAEFDPAKLDWNKLMASFAGLGIVAGAASQSDQAQAAENTNEPPKAEVKFGAETDPYEKLPQPNLSGSLSIPLEHGSIGISGHYQTFPYSAKDKWDARLGVKIPF